MQQTAMSTRMVLRSLRCYWSSSASLASASASWANSSRVLQSGNGNLLSLYLERRWFVSSHGGRREGRFEKDGFGAQRDIDRRREHLQHEDRPSSSRRFSSPSSPSRSRDREPRRSFDDNLDQEPRRSFDDDRRSQDRKPRRSFDREPRRSFDRESRRPSSSSSHRYARRAPSLEPPPFGTDYLYGTHPVLNALIANYRAFECLYLQEHHPSSSTSSSSSHSSRKFSEEILNLAKKHQIPIKNVDKATLEHLVGDRPHQGVVLHASRLEAPLIHKLPNLSSSSSSSSSSLPKVYLALDGITDPQNLGSILRVAYFLGVEGIVMSLEDSAPLSPSVSKASSGVLERMISSSSSIHHTKNLLPFLEESQLNGWKVLGTSLSPQSIPCHLLHYQQKLLWSSSPDSSSSPPSLSPIILVLGGEGYGARRKVLELCDALITIPPGCPSRGEVVDSLNVSVATGIILHQLLTPHNP